MKKGIVIIALLLSPLLAKAQGEGAILSQILVEEKLNNAKTDRLNRRLSALIELQEKELEIRQRKEEVELSAPNELLIANQKILLEQKKEKIIETSRMLIQGVKNFEYLDKKDYAEGINIITKTLTSSTQIYAQINSLLSANSLIPANERIAVLENSLEILDKNIMIINNYNSHLKSVNEARAFRELMVGKPKMKK